MLIYEGSRNIILSFPCCTLNIEPLVDTMSTWVGNIEWHFLIFYLLFGKVLFSHVNSSSIHFPFICYSQYLSKNSSEFILSQTTFHLLLRLSLSSAEYLSIPSYEILSQRHTHNYVLYVCIYGTYQQAENAHFLYIFMTFWGLYLLLLFFFLVSMMSDICLVNSCVYTQESNYILYGFTCRYHSTTTGCCYCGYYCTGISVMPTLTAFTYSIMSVWWNVTCNICVCRKFRSFTEIVEITVKCLAIP